MVTMSIVGHDGDDKHIHGDYVIATLIMLLLALIIYGTDGRCQSTAASAW